MKTTLTDNGDYKVLAELTNANYPSDLYALKFSTQFTGAKDPVAEQHKFTVFLNKEQRELLKSML